VKRLPAWVWIMLAVAVGIVLVVTAVVLVSLLNPRFAHFHTDLAQAGGRP